VPKYLLFVIWYPSPPWCFQPVHIPKGIKVLFPSRETENDDDDDDGMGMALKGHCFLYNIHAAANYYLGLHLIKFLSVVN